MRLAYLLAAAIAVVTAGCSAATVAGPPAPSAAGPSARAATTATTAPVARIPLAPGSLNGVYEAASPASYAGVDGFAAETGATPRVALYYSGGQEPFKARFAQQAWTHGAYVLMQLQPYDSLAKVIAGSEDAYLRRLAGEVRAFGHPVIIGFGHEMNGGWYPWGEGHATPAQFIAAWRHVVSVFRAVGALNVAWLWDVNAVNAASVPLRQWWPGAAWVTLVGIDGYFYFPGDTFASVFGRTLTEIRRFTSLPVLIAETAVGTTADRVAQINGLFAGAKADRIAGVVWFDHAQNDPPYHQDWTLSDDPAALAAFRAAVRGFG